MADGGSPQAARQAIGTQCRARSRFSCSDEARRDYVARAGWRYRYMRFINDRAIAKGMKISISPTITAASGRT
jgi:hypothetical protein